MGLLPDHIIRPFVAEIPLSTKWDTPIPCSLALIEEYSHFLNTNYAIGDDYHHNYTIKHLKARLFGNGVLSYEVRHDTHIVGMIASVPLKVVRGGQFGQLIEKSPSGTTVGLIDYLCIVKNSGDLDLLNI